MGHIYWGPEEVILTIYARIAQLTSTSMVKFQGLNKAFFKYCVYIVKYIKFLGRNDFRIIKRTIYYIVDRSTGTLHGVKRQSCQTISKKRICCLINLLRANIIIIISEIFCAFLGSSSLCIYVS